MSPHAELKTSTERFEAFGVSRTQVGEGDSALVPSNKAQRKQLHGQGTEVFVAPNLEQHCNMGLVV